MTNKTDHTNTASDAEKSPITEASASGDTVIDAASLEQITGLSARRLRQLASAGYFPAPDHGRYQLRSVFAGMVRHLREQIEKAGGPIADERQQHLRARREIAETQLSILRRDVIPLGDVCGRLLAISEELKNTLRIQLLDQLPAHNAGLDAAKQRENNRTAFNEICDRFQAFAAEYDATLQAAEAKKAPKQPAI